ncbi:MAG: IS21 family transposase [Chitinivibrionales bacterium]
MPERKSMRRIKECLRLHYEAKLSQSAIAGALRIARSTVWDYLKRAEQSDISWTELKDLSEEELERRLFSNTLREKESRPLPDWDYIHKELHRKSYVTLRLLWEEYIATHSNGYSYPRFCLYYRNWAKKLKVYQRQRHIGGEKLFADYSGKKPVIRDPQTGEDREVELLIMCWGASQYTYAEAHESQKLPDWIMGHRRGYEYFGCVPQIEVDDNLKSAVTKACRYDPDLNRTYTQFAEHYGVAVIPARPSKPKDKGKVENAILIAQRWILARLRNRIFYSLQELNAEIRILLKRLNDKPMQKLPKSRKQLFEELDLPNAKSLPTKPFEYRDWEYPTLAFDYHIEIDKHFYSAPWTLAGRKLSVRIMEEVIEIFYKDERVALHQRGRSDYHYTTVRDHMPEKHRQCIEWSPARLYNWAKQIGPATYRLIQKVIKKKFHPQQGFRPAVGILRLAKTYGEVRLEAAAEIALRYDFVRVAQIADLLKNGKDRSPQITDTVKNTAQTRGREYYEQTTLPL